MDYDLMRFESGVTPIELQLVDNRTFGEVGTVIDGHYQYDGTGLWAIMNIAELWSDIVNMVLCSYIEISEGGDIPSIDEIIADVVIMYLDACYERAEFDYMGEPEWEDEEYRDQIVSDYIQEADYEGLYGDFEDLLKDQLMYLNLTFTIEDEQNSYCPLIINDAQIPLLLNPHDGSLELYGRK